jgi:hypothetical protein
MFTSSRLSAHPLIQVAERLNPSVVLICLLSWIVPVNFRSLCERDLPAIKPHSPLNGQLLQIEFAQLFFCKII